jgi:hypothetical protein
MDPRISVRVESDGSVQARRLSNNEPSPKAQVGYSGIDAELIGMFERWLTLRDRVWREDEIRVFGSLLHRCLFSDDMWFWIQSAIDDRGEGRIRLELIFPANPPYSRLAAIPWEYLYRPDRAGKNGMFLAADPGLILSRYIPLEAGEEDFTPEEQLRVLVMVSEPDDPRLEPVDYEDVLAAIDDAGRRLGFVVAVAHNPTAEDLRQAVIQAAQRPHLVHFMGHGEFDPGMGRGALAFTHPAGGTDWVDDRRLATVLTQDGIAPRAVVLHSCEGGRADFAASFAGVAPQLVRSGVQCVVAMQYAVTNETAIDFSTSLYGQLASGVDLDTAVQVSRSRISREPIPPDPRLLGIPVVYLQNRTALLAEPSLGEAVRKDGE